MAFCSGLGGNSACCSSGQSASQDRGAEQDAGNQLPQDGRLADTLHCLAEEPPAGQ
jgi:hypothetical protein